MSDPPARVGDRYEIVRRLGGGSQGVTYLARHEDGREVVLKRFSVREMRGWKSLELFRREIATLGVLDHPAIPDFIDDLEFDGSHYLVQEFIDGRVLSEVVAEGPLAEPELRAVMKDVLEVLAYLHELNPPVVHRDVKPSNIICRPNGEHALVDFGGVQMIVAQDTGGSTVIGTTGYMPSEQLVGRAVPQSDLYALGATLAHLATGVHPSELPTKRLRIDWRPAAEGISPALSDLIDEMLNPAPEDRPSSARAALASLATAGIRTSSELVSVDLVDPVARSMRRHIIRGPQRLEVVVRARDTLEWLKVVPGVAVIGVLIVLQLEANLVRAVGVMAIVAIVLAVRQLSLRSDRLVIGVDGRAHLTHDDQGLAHRGVSRGELTETGGRLHILTDEGVSVRVAESLNAKQAQWLIKEVAAFVESANRTASLPPAPPVLEPTPTLEAEPVPEPEPLPAAEPEVFVEALPDRDSNFDRGHRGDDTMALLRRSTADMTREAYRPAGECPRGLLKRMNVQTDTMRLDLGPRLDISNLYIAILLLTFGGLAALLMQSWFVLIAAVVFALVGGLSSAVSRRHQTLAVSKDRRYLLRDHDGDRNDIKQGVLVPKVRLDDHSVRIATVGGDDVLVGGWLSDLDRAWVAHHLSEWLDNDDDE